LKLHLLFRVSQNPAKGIVEIEKVALEIHLINAFLNIFNKRLVPLTGDPFMENRRFFSGIWASFSALPGFFMEGRSPVFSIVIFLPFQKFAYIIKKLYVLQSSVTTPFGQLHLRKK